MKPYLKLGTWDATCDVCGFQFKADQLKKRWDNLMVCTKDYEPRHPQDFVKGIPDKQSVPWTRPDATELDVSPNYPVNTLTPVPPGTFNNGT